MKLGDLVDQKVPLQRSGRGVKMGRKGIRKMGKEKKR